MARSATAPPRRLRLGDRTDSRENNFDLLRLVAAWLVLVSHSFALTGFDEPLHQFGTTLGNVSVLVFFAISGLLIYRSWEYGPRLGDFVRKRALRLLPGLAVVALLTAFVLGPIVTDHSLGDYVASAQTWIYPIRVTLLYPFGAELPGVFTSNEYPNAVNGPLWSLPVEVTAYGMLAALGVLGLLRRRWVVALLAAAAIVVTPFWFAAMPFEIAQISVLSGFALGSAAYAFRERVVLWWPLALAALVAAVVFADTPLRPAVWTIAATYLSFYVAYAIPPRLGFLTRFGDASYGIYIYAFPIQQLVAWRFPDIGPWAMIAVVTPIVWVLAQASWHWVERPALRHKPKPRTALSTFDENMHPVTRPDEIAAEVAAHTGSIENCAPATVDR